MIHLRSATAIAGFVLVLGVAVVAATKQWWEANVAFLVIGAAVSILGGFLANWVDVPYARRDLAQLLYLEVCDRAARCAYDFLQTWDEVAESGDRFDAFRLRKFKPLPLELMKANSARLHLLGPTVVKALIHFQYQLTAWERDLENAASNLSGSGVVLGKKNTQLLRNRLMQTAGPAIKAIEALSGLARLESSNIEHEALARYDIAGTVKSPLRDALFSCERKQIASTATVSAST